MNDRNIRFNPPPSAMSEEAFVARVGSVYEHSPWIARQAWRRGLSTGQDSVEGLSAALAAVVDAADAQAQRELVLAHPDLGGSAAVRGELTNESTREQASAGLTQCTPEEFERLQRLNTAYRDKFGFPFIMAVKGRQRGEILATMEQRLDNDPVTEQGQALKEIHKIARLRLRDLAQAGPCRT